MINTFDFAWLVGLLEGEGCFTLNGSANNKQPMILLQMTDKDVVLRAANILGGSGFVSGKERKDSGGTYGKKTIYRYGVGGSLSIFWMRIILPHMSERRQIQIKYIVENYDSIPHRRSSIVFPLIEGVA